MHFLGGYKRKAIAQVESHLVTKNASCTGAGTIAFIYARIYYMLYKIEVLLHGRKVNKKAAGEYTAFPQPFFKIVLVKNQGIFSHNRMKKLSIPFFIIPIFLAGCSATNGFLAKKPARDAYADALKKTDTTAAGNFTRLGTAVLASPKTVKKNFTEKGKIEKGLSTAAALKFSLIAGQRTDISMLTSAKVFIDIWEQQPDGGLKHLVSADTLTKSAWVSTTRGGDYVVRWQSAFGKEATGYELNLETSPLLGWPIATGYKSRIGSVWGDARDGGARKHEGIDIMADRGVPVVAVADGIITNVGSNEIGGLVVSMRPKGSNLSIYYAHLSQQSVREGQSVTKGQELGKVGNTGNASGTVPHLHFGIYDRYSGAINPIGFVSDR